MKKRNLKSPYGIIPMEILINRELNTTEKLVYSILVVKQGGSDHAKVTTQMLTDALRKSDKTIRSAIKKLKAKVDISEISRGKYKTKDLGGQFGVVELDFLITSALSSSAKYLYLIYCAAANDYDTNFWGRKMLVSKYQMSNSTYHKAQKELLNIGLLNTRKQFSAPYVQTANINVIERANKVSVTIPTSWMPPEPFDLDRCCMSELGDNNIDESETEILVPGNGSLGTNEDEESVQRSITINSNPNNKICTNEASAFGLDIKKEDKAADPSNINKLQNKKLTSEEDALKIIKKVVAISPPKGFLNYELTDPKIIHQAFVAFEELIDTLKQHRFSTENYSLNYQDILTYARFTDAHRLCTDERIRYHVMRVTELGIKEGNSYISFSYVFSENTFPKYEFKKQNGRKRKMKRMEYG